MPWILKLHITCALISISGFVVRGIWMLRDSPRLRARWVRIAPHVVDTLLLVTGLVMVFRLRLYPGQQPWLTAKLIALVVYIALGMVALKRGRTKARRAWAWGGALLVFAYILAVARTRAVNPLPILW